MKVVWPAIVAVWISQAAPAIAGGQPSYSCHQELTYIGDNSELDYYYLDCCEGDCDHDSDCRDHLKCFQRDGSEPVPGCYGSGYVGNDYCYDPLLECGKAITYVGDDSEIEDYSLGCCEGDCDANQCAPGLECFHRDGTEYVPGCSGQGVLSGIDICIDPNAATSGTEECGGALTFVGNDEDLDGYLLGCCEGDCDDDGDCAGDLVCFQRDGTDTVPGCSQSGRYAGKDFCVDPDELDSAVGSSECGGDLTFVGNDQELDGYLLGCCEGDCDQDDDCAGDLVCFHRDATETVPGCSRSGSLSGKDFCVDPDEVGSVGSSECGGDLTYVGDNSELDGYLLGCCEGDCDAGQCAPGLECFHRDATEFVPGCSNQGIRPGHDFCYDPEDPPFIVGDTTCRDRDITYLGTGNELDGYLLGCCEGDCNEDDDCAGNLVCFHRDATETVPGCSRSGRFSGKDFCVDPDEVISVGSSECGGDLTYVGDNSELDGYLLGCCEGDCDAGQCAPGLECFHRDATEFVPGCSNQGIRPGHDFCYDPYDPPFIVGDTTSCDRDITFLGTGNELDGYLLGCCEGDCNRDSDCAGHLVCFHRDATEEVPGCDGRNQYPGKDFCIDPDDLAPPTGGGCGGPLTYVGDDSDFYGMLSCCEGDCDAGDCSPGLECFHRSDTEFVPGCSGQGVLSGVDICYDPHADGSTMCGGSLVYVGNDYNLGDYKLGCCEGDCDHDSDCAGDLMCFQRHGRESVPGCLGSGRSGKDYCYDPSISPDSEDGGYAD